MGIKSKIDWCDSSWNPVTGCKHGCPYCYARRIAQRYGCRIKGDMGSALAVLEEPYRRADNGQINPYPYEFLPTFHEYRLEIPARWTKPRTIFVCSMADLFGEWVPLEWIQEVFEACRKAPQHRYLFLTKAPERYISLAKLGQLPTKDNFWFGSSAPTPDTQCFYSDKHNTFVSMEPLLAEFGPWGIDTPAELPRWIIIGAETGNRKGKVTPKKAWVDEIAEQALIDGIPVFMKESLRNLMGEDFRQEYPWEA